MDTLARGSFREHWHFDDHSTHLWNLSSRLRNTRMGCYGSTLPDGTLNRLGLKEFRYGEDELTRMRSFLKNTLRTRMNFYR